MKRCPGYELRLLGYYLKTDLLDTIFFYLSLKIKVAKALHNPVIRGTISLRQSSPSSCDPGFTTSV